MTKAYYNEFDPKAAEWLRQLIKSGDITPGYVDDRSITEVTPNDLRGYSRVHFFAGIGTWDYALNQAGWGVEQVWTASLPCQPFSVAGKGLGKSDERHLLPHFIELVRQCKPSILFGEQVPGAIKHGWLDDLYAEMEACEYAIGSIIIGAHSVGAAHIRQRLYWLANSVNNSGKREIRRGDGETQSCAVGDRQGIVITGQSSRTSSDVCGLADASDSRRQPQQDSIASEICGASLQQTKQREQSSNMGAALGRMADASGQGLQRRIGAECGDKQFVREDSLVNWIYCRDGKCRPIEPGIQPLVDGAAEKLVRGGDTSASIDANATQEARAMRLKGYGNAIQAQTAELFIRACMSI